MVGFRSGAGCHPGAIPAWLLLGLFAASASAQGAGGPALPRGGGLPPPAGSSLSRTLASAMPAAETVVEVRIVGNKRLSKKEIRRHIQTRAGRPYVPEQLEEDVRRLNRSGMFVKPYTQQVDGGRIVVFEIFERPTIKEVKFVGNSKIKKKVLLDEADLDVGGSFDMFAVEQARRRIEEFYHGKGFADAHVTIFEGGKPTDSRVVFVVNEGVKQKVLSTRFVGNTIVSGARLKTLIKSKPGILWLLGGGVDRKQIEEDVERLTAYYRGLGFFSARIGRELDFDRANKWLVLTFVIHEGPRYRIRNLSLVGNAKIPTDDLAAKLKLHKGDFFDQRKLSSDVATIEDTYGGQGYVFADVHADPRLFEQPGELDLVYQITEGQRCRVGKIDVNIKGDFPHTEIFTVLDRLSLKPGDILDSRELRKSERRLGSAGMFRVDRQQGVVPTIAFSPPSMKELQRQRAQVATRPGPHRGQSPEQPGSTPPPAARPVFRGQYSAERGRTVPSLPSGPPVSAPAAGGTSLPATPPQPGYAAAPVVPPAVGSTSSGGGNSLFPPPGSTYSPPGQYPPPGQLPAPNDSAAGTFFSPPGSSQSSMSPLLGLPPNQDPALDLPLRINTEETETGRFMFSAGVNSDAGVVGSIVVDEQNFDWRRFPRSWEDIRNMTAFRGRGQRFRLEAVPGTELQRYSVTFQEPYLFSTNVSLGLNGFYYTRYYREWNEQRLGYRVSLGYMLTPDLSVATAFRQSRVNLSAPPLPTPPEIANALGDSDLYGFSVKLSHDTRDSTFLATEGHLFQLGFEQVVGTFDYPRADLTFRRYFMLHERPDGSGRHVLSLSASSSITGGDTPVYEHYFAGGFSTIRGFDYRGASPHSSGTVVGGHYSLLASAEYLFPITAGDALHGVVFCDTGVVQPSINDWRDRYRVAPGFGLRVTIPAMGPAPIALDFAFPVTHEPGDRIEVFSFFIGFLR